MRGRKCGSTSTNHAPSSSAKAFPWPAAARTTADEAKRIAAGRWRGLWFKVAGPDRRQDEGRGVKFADTPREARPRRRTSSSSRSAAHMPRGVLVGRQRRDQAGVLRRGDLRRHAQDAHLRLQRHGRDRHRGGWPNSTPTTSARHFSTILRTWTSGPEDVVASIGSPARSSTASRPPLEAGARCFVKYDMTLAEINPLAQLA